MENQAPGSEQRPEMPAEQNQMQQSGQRQTQTNKPASQRQDQPHDSDPGEARDAEANHGSTAAPRRG